MSGSCSSSKSPSSNSSSSSRFASLFASTTTSISLQPPQPPAFTDMIHVMACSDPSSDYAPTTSTEPISLCLSTTHGASIFGAASQDLRQYTPAPQPAMSATALLQKAAQMGAAASNASFLRGLGLVPSSSSATPQESSPWNQRQVEPDGISIAAGLGLGLPCDGNSGLKELMRGNHSLFAPKHTTLDFLGLGMAAGGSPNNRGLAALITSIGGGMDVGTTTGSYGGGDISSKDMNRNN